MMLAAMMAAGAATLAAGDAVCGAGARCGDMCVLSHGGAGRCSSQPMGGGYVKCVAFIPQCGGHAVMGRAQDGSKARGTGGTCNSGQGMECGMRCKLDDFTDGFCSTISAGFGLTKCLAKKTSCQRPPNPVGPGGEPLPEGTCYPGQGMECGMRCQLDDFTDGFCSTISAGFGLTKCLAEETSCTNKPDNPVDPGGENTDGLCYPGQGMKCGMRCQLADGSDGFCNDVSAGFGLTTCVSRKVPCNGEGGGSGGFGGGRMVAPAMARATGPYDPVSPGTGMCYSGQGMTCGMRCQLEDFSDGFCSTISAGFGVTKCLPQKTSCDTLPVDPVDPVRPPVGPGGHGVDPTPPPHPIDPVGPGGEHPVDPIRPPVGPGGHGVDPTPPPHPIDPVGPGGEHPHPIDPVGPGGEPDIRPPNPVGPGGEHPKPPVGPGGIYNPPVGPGGEPTVPLEGICYPGQGMQCGMRCQLEDGSDGFCSNLSAGFGLTKCLPQKVACGAETADAVCMPGQGARCGDLCYLDDGQWGFCSNESAGFGLTKCLRQQTPCGGGGGDDFVCDPNSAPCGTRCYMGANRPLGYCTDKAAGGGYTTCEDRMPSCITGVQFGGKWGYCAADTGTCKPCSMNDGSVGQCSDTTFTDRGQLFLACLEPQWAPTECSERQTFTYPADLGIGRSVAGVAAAAALTAAIFAATRCAAGRKALRQGQETEALLSV